MKKEEIEQKVNEVEKISTCVLYKNGTAKEVPNTYTFQAHIDIPKMVKNMELAKQEELIDWIIEKISDRQIVMKDNETKIVMSDGEKIELKAPVIILQHSKKED